MLVLHGEYNVQLLKIFGATFERYPSNLCKSLTITPRFCQLSTPQVSSLVESYDFSDPQAG